MHHRWKKYAANAEERGSMDTLKAFVPHVFLKVVLGNHDQRRMLGLLSRHEEAHRSYPKGRLSAQEMGVNGNVTYNDYGLVRYRFFVNSDAFVSEGKNLQA